MSLNSHVRFVAPAFNDVAEPAAGSPVGATPSDTATPTAAVAPAPDDAPMGEPDPPGAPLVRALERGFAERGWQLPYRWSTPYGQAFECRRGEHRYDLEVQLLDADTGAWLVTAVPRRGLLRRFFRGGVDEQEYALLLTHLRDVLAADARVSAARWFDEDGWRATPRGPGAEQPVA